MILIADSGSTKTDWRLIDNSGETLLDFSTMGFNPYFHTADLVEEKMKESLGAMSINKKVQHVFFYGAGCSSDSLQAIIREGLERIFISASVSVDHDLKACAYATYFGEPIISCILGTGSNSCAFDGETVYEEVPSLAFILGDEGSGSCFGKKLIRDYFYKKLPKEISNAFFEEFGLTDKKLVNMVYNEPNANVYLASFTRFIGQFRHHPHVKNWLNDGFREFIDIHVKCFDNWADVKVHFIGSVAFYFLEDLKQACLDEGVQIGTVIQKPIDNLVRYHIEYLLPELVKV
ncbi:MAG: ATPase [Flavobacteriales bacterium]